MKCNTIEYFVSEFRCWRFDFYLFEAFFIVWFSYLLLFWFLFYLIFWFHLFILFLQNLNLQFFFQKKFN